MNRKALLLCLTLLSALIVYGTFAYTGTFVVYGTYANSFTYTYFNNETANYFELDEARTSWTVTITPEIVWNETTTSPTCNFWIAKNGSDTGNTDLLSFNMYPKTVDSSNYIGFELYRGDVGGTWDKLVIGSQVEDGCVYKLRLDDDGDLYIGNTTDYDAYTSTPITYGTSHIISHVATFGANDTATAGYITFEITDYSATMTGSLISIMPSIMSLALMSVAIGMIAKYMKT